MAKKNAANVVGVKTKTTWKQAFKRDWQLYLLLLFPLIMVIVFSYGAYPGLRMAFMDYKPAKGYAGSEWVGMKTFIKIFKDADFMRALRNSVVFNLADLLVGFPMPIILALILNELISQIQESITDDPVSATFPFLGYHRKRSHDNVSSELRSGEYPADEPGSDLRRNSFPE